MRSGHDAILLWPFKKAFTIILIDQEEDEKKRKNIQRTLTPAGQKYFEKPKSEENEGFGFPGIASYETLKTRKYIVDDTVFIKVYVEE